MAVDTVARQRRAVAKPAESVAEASTTLEWEASDGADLPRDKRVLIGVAAVGLVAVLGLVWARQWLGAGVVILATVALLTIRRRDAHTHRIRITDQEVSVDNMSYPYKSLRSFWIIESEEGPLLHLEGTGRLGRLHQLPLGATSVDAVREFLTDHLPEEADRGEDLSYRLARWLRL